MPRRSIIPFAVLCALLLPLSAAAAPRCDWNSLAADADRAAVTVSA
ncbi:DUF4893 domain-containing protein, partial [Xanthomonas sontii]